MESENIPTRIVKKQEDEQGLIQFVEEQIEKMKGYLHLGAGKEINFYELEEALKGHENVHLALIGMYNVSRISLQKEEQEFDLWFSKKFLEIRSEVNRPELTAQKWAGQKEIEMMVKVRNEEEYKKIKGTLNVIEGKASFLKELMTSWSNYQWILKILSDNVRSEVGMSNMENRQTRT